MDWNITPIRVPLTYLRITVHRVADLLAIMSTRPLSTTLRQLHVKLRDKGVGLSIRASEMKIAFRMSSLHTFTFVKSLSRKFPDEWTLIDTLTSSTIMPVLRRAKLIVAINVWDLNRIDRSALFNDDRRVDVQYAFGLTDHRSHTYLYPRIPRGSRSHPRCVASATFVENTSIDARPHPSALNFYVSHSSGGSFSSSSKINGLVFVFADTPCATSISFVVHFAMVLQRTRSTLSSRQAYRPIGSMATASSTKDGPFISCRSSRVDLQPGVTYSLSITDHQPEERRRIVSLLL